MSEIIVKNTKEQLKPLENLVLNSFEYFLHLH